MKPYQKAARVIADEGIAGLLRRSKDKILRTTISTRETPSVDAVARAY